MALIRVSAVKYTNSIPFIYGLQHDSLENDILLSLDTPAQCYNSLLCGNADIGLVPVIFKNHVSSVYQVSEYGIAADGNVLSVILVSSSPIEEVKRIYLDYQSRTSVMLAKLLCRDWWIIQPEFIIGKPGFENEEFFPGEARLIIGDRAFDFYKQKDIFITDLAGEWKKFTGFPFVFAFWASTEKLDPGFEIKFIKSLDSGMAYKSRLIDEIAGRPEYKNIDLHKYLNENIFHEISPAMHQGMNLFLLLIRDLE